MSGINVVVLCMFLLSIICTYCAFYFLFFFNDTATTEIYTLSLHDALPISFRTARGSRTACRRTPSPRTRALRWSPRSEEHTSELQSLAYLVCRLLLEKKKKKNYRPAS